MEVFFRHSLFDSTKLKKKKLNYISSTIRNSHGTIDDYIFGKNQRNARKNRAPKTHFKNKIEKLQNLGYNNI